MFDQFLDSFRRASESSVQVQQDLFKQWQQQWFTSPSAAAAAGDGGRAFQKRCLELTVEILNKHRESLDAGYKAGIQAIEEVFRASDAKSPEDYRRASEELWRKLFVAFRSQYETQLQELQKFAAISFDMAQKPAQAAQS